MYRVRMAALAAALMVGITTVAAAQSAPDSVRQERSKHGRMGKARGGMQRALFRGITLTDAQQSRLEAIRASYQPRFQSLRESAQPAMQAMRDARQKQDTAASRAAFSSMQKHRAEMRALMDRQRADLRGVLTGEQQTTFDKNLSELRDRAAKRGERRGKARGGPRQGERRGHRGA